MTDAVSAALLAYLRQVGPGPEPAFMREAIRAMSEALLEPEGSQRAGAGRYGRREGRRTRRNGYRERTWQTRVGESPRRPPDCARAAASRACGSRGGGPSGRARRAQAGDCGPAAGGASWQRRRVHSLRDPRARVPQRDTAAGAALARTTSRRPARPAGGGAAAARGGAPAGGALAARRPAPAGRRGRHPRLPGLPARALDPPLLHRPARAPQPGGQAAHRRRRGGPRRARRLPPGGRRPARARRRGAGRAPLLQPSRAPVRRPFGPEPTAELAPAAPRLAPVRWPPGRQRPP